VVFTRVGDLAASRCSSHLAECSDFHECAKWILAAVAAGTIAGPRAVATNATASTEYASLLLRSSHFETRHTAPLPPCPDPPPAASPRADSVPTRALTPAES